MQSTFIHESTERNKDNAKKTWQSIRKFWPYLNKKSQNILNEKDATDKEVANSFNDFFANVGKELADNIEDTEDSPLDFEPMPQIFELGKSNLRKS